MIAVKTIESDEIVGHVAEFAAQILAPMIQSGEIASIDAVFTGELSKALLYTWVLVEGIEISCIHHIYGCKKQKKNIRTAIRNAAL